MNLFYSYLNKLSPKIKISKEIKNAPGGIRTPNNGSEDRCDIHFTTGAKSSKITINFRKNKETQVSLFFLIFYNLVN